MGGVTLLKAILTIATVQQGNLSLQGTMYPLVWPLEAEWKGLNSSGCRVSALDSVLSAHGNSVLR